jgi:glutamate synthase domain-containing protein 3
MQEWDSDFMRIDAKGMHYRELNKIIRDAVQSGENEFELDNICGQRYIGAGLNDKVSIIINGTPGNDLGAFMNGPRIIVNANAQDGIANTMNSGEIVVHGSAGDIAGYGMRGGKVYIEKDAGYRAGIHMKEYKKQVPAIIVGGTAGDFFGEYMAGGIMILLGINEKTPIAGDYVGTGMHGGIIYIRGKVDPYHLGKEVSCLEVNEEDMKLIGSYLREYCGYFGFDLNEVMDRSFMKLIPLSHRPYGSLYVY